MEINWKKSLAWKQILLITPLVLAIVLLLVSYISYHSTELLTEEINLRSKNSSRLVAIQIENIFTNAEVITRNIATVVENSNLSDSELQTLLKKSFEKIHKLYPEIIGGSIAFEKNMRHKNREYCMWYTAFDKGKQYFVDVNGKDYDYFSFDWYKDFDKNNGSWGEPYFDEGLGNITMTTFSYPLHNIVDGKKVFVGVVTADICLDNLKEYVDKLTMNASFAFLITNTGKIVIHPKEEWVMAKTVFDIAPPEEKEAFHKMWREILIDNFNSIEYPFNTSIYGESDAMISYAKVPCNKWIVGSIASEGLIFESLLNLKKYVTIFAIVIIIFTMIALAMLTIKALTPLRILVPIAKEIGSGNFSVKIDESNRRDEVGELNNAFVVMQRSLQKYTQELKETIAIKNRFESELEIAKQIQQSLLPKLFFPNGYELFASLTPAKEVGGDLYDFFMLSPTKICLVIGDVSGKGVPASLFMAVSQTLHRGLAQEVNLSTEQIVSQMNQTLCHNNDAGLFVTYIFCVLDLNTGDMLYTNAGHNPFYIIKQDETIFENKNRNGLPLGVRSASKYSSNKINLKFNETLVFYTDGVTEAQNNKNEFFGTDRLEKVLKQAAKDKLSPKEIDDAVQKAVNEFVGDAEQFDDITLLCIQRQ